jgi:predicted permease
VPPFLRRFFAGLRALVRKREAEREMDEELRGYLEAVAEAKMRAGMSGEEARRAARVEMGSQEAVKENVRGAGWEAAVESLWRDVIYGARMLRKSPGFSAVVVFTLALGIGGTTTIFSLVDATLLRPLPVAHPAQMVAIFTSDFSGPLYGTSSYPDYADFRENNGVFSGMVAWQFTAFSLATTGTAERVYGELVSGNYFEVLGVRPALGRGFRAEEGSTKGARPVAVISHALWEKRFAGARDVLGSSISLNGVPFTVVGVAPPGFSGLTRGLVADLWVPAAILPRILPGNDDMTNRGSRSFFLMGRLNPGADLAQAQARFRVIARQLHQSYPAQWTDVHSRPRVITLVPESRARVFPQARGTLLGVFALLMTVAGFVVLIACANVAGLLLARGSTRRREIAIRQTMGATRGRLVRQLLIESLLLALAAGAGGLFLAMWGTRLLGSFRPPLPVPFRLDLAIDARVLGFTLALAVLTGLIFGLAPALAASRPELIPSLTNAPGGNAAGIGRHRLRSGFVLVQVALSVLLLVGAGLFLRSLRNATVIDPGFVPENVLIGSVDLRLAGYNSVAGAAFYRQLLERVRAMPGVVDASLADELPLGLGGSRRGITIEGYTPRAGEDMEVYTATVASDYFRTMRIPILRGRGFADSDAEGAPRVVVVNQAFARRYWPGEDPIGRHIQMGIRNRPGTPWWEVVGVARDGKYLSLGEEPLPFFYLPLAQFYRSSTSLVVRTHGAPLSLLPAVRDEVAGLDKSLPLTGAETLVDHTGLSLLPARLAGAVLGAFGVVGLLLAAMGVYGVMAFAVAQRTREIGIRMALGAERREIFRLVVRQGMVLTAVGCAVGLAAAVVLTRFLTSLLYGVSPTDPWTIAAVLLVLAVTALAACYLPARRAMRVDPMTALRHE